MFGKKTKYTLSANKKVVYLVKIYLMWNSYFKWINSHKGNIHVVQNSLNATFCQSKKLHYVRTRCICKVCVLQVLTLLVKKCREILLILALSKVVIKIQYSYFFPSSAWHGWYSIFMITLVLWVLKSLARRRLVPHELI